MAAGKLHCAGTWHSDPLRHEKFEALTAKAGLRQESVCPVGSGRQGRHVGLRVTGDTNFPRASSACLEGLHSAFGFPIRLDKEVLGVIEFFSHEIRKPNLELLRCLMRCSQVGQFIQRKRAESELRGLNLELEKRVTDAQPNCIGPRGAAPGAEAGTRTEAGSKERTRVIL